MTEVLERPVAAAAPTRVPFDLSVAWRVLLATLSGAAAVIHLVMAPSHAGESTVEGVGFLVAGWLQVFVAVALLRSASRLVVRLTIALNALLIGVWAVSRVWGLPFGDHAGHPENVSTVDLTCVAVEAALIVGCLVALLRPGFGRGWDRSRLLFGAAAPAAVILFVSGVLVSPSARDHAGASHGDHGAAAGHGHDEAADANGLAALENGHQHGAGWEDLDDATQTALASQLNQTRLLIDKYPTVAAAEAAGYRRAGPFAPGLGVHYINFAGYGGGNPDALQMGDERLTPTIIYDGLAPDSPIAGFMYLVLGNEGEPEGFVGPNDHWHYHTQTCLVIRDGIIEAPLGADQPNVTEEMCDQYGGSLIANTGYMLHVWTVPGYESERGVFSEINPALPCPDGNYFTIPLDEIGFKTTTCRE